MDAITLGKSAKAGRLHHQFVEKMQSPNCHLWYITGSTIRNRSDQRAGAARTAQLLASQAGAKHSRMVHDIYCAIKRPALAIVDIGFYGDADRDHIAGV